MASSSTRTLAALFTAGLVTFVISACGEAPNDGTSEHLGSTTEDLTTIARSQVLARGQLWVAAKLPYCQSANHQPDGDKACAKVCTRPNNAQWDPYRSDCSGFVSWSWGLSAPGRTTAELAPAVTDITHTIDPKSLMPGDAVNKPSDHTMLFVKWITPGTRATFMEEPGCSASQPYARQIDSNVTISGQSITLAENGITFSAIRFNAITDDPDAGTGSGGDSGSGGSGSGGSGGSADDDGGGSGGFGAPHDRAVNTDAPTSNESSGGCAMSHEASTSDAASSMALAGLAFLAIRKRRRARA